MSHSICCQAFVVSLCGNSKLHGGAGGWAIRRGLAAELESNYQAMAPAGRPAGQATRYLKRSLDRKGKSSDVRSLRLRPYWPVLNDFRRSMTAWQRGAGHRCRLNGQRNVGLVAASVDPDGTSAGAAIGGRFHVPSAWAMCAMRTIS